MWKYLKSREFLLTLLGLVVGIGLVYVLFFFVFLPLYTNHGESTQVPDVTELTLDEAISKFEAEGFRYEVVDSLYDSNLEPLAIISQDPLGGSEVKPGRRIYLTVNKQVAPMVKMPNIFGVTQYQAKLSLEGANLKVGSMEYVYHQYANLVISATYKGRKLKEGDKIPQFSKINLTIGKGKGSQRVEVPNLVGQHYQTAIGMLNRLGLHLGAYKFVPGPSDQDGMVVQQSPRYTPGDSISMGEEIVIFISGPEIPEALEDISVDDDSTAADTSRRRNP